MTAPYGYARNVVTECCIASDTDQARMLCGLKRGFMPVVPPVFPARVCVACEAEWVRRGRYVWRLPVATGVCPVCAGDAPLNAEGRVAGHGAWMVGRHGPRVSQVACDGSGQWPEAGA